MYGWAGQRLRVNLTTGEIKKEPLSYEYRRKWIGGRGFNSDVIYNEVPVHLDPYDPEARVCFGMGPISGTAAPSTGRVTVSCKSPLTGGFGDSNMGGHWGAEVKFAGYDQIIVQGKAKNPVYIWIDDDKVEIRDARHLWGKFPREADQMIKEELKDEDIHIMLIGPAGENMVRFASTYNDVWRCAGRTGTGGVIGSKNLKGIATRGSGTVKIAEPKKMMDVCNRLRQTFKNDPMKIGLNVFGSLCLINVANRDGWLPWKNFQEGAHPLANNMSGETHSETVLDEAAQTGQVIAFVGKPHDLIKRSELKKALNLIGYTDYVQAERFGKVVYMEGSTDISMIKAFAQLLGHPIVPMLDRLFVKYLSSNRPDDTYSHFFGLREAFADLRGWALYDRIDKRINEKPGLMEAMWKRREFVNYLHVPDVLYRWAELQSKSPAMTLHPREAMRTAVQKTIAPAHIEDPEDQWWHEEKMSDAILAPVFSRYFKELGLPVAFNKGDYYRLVALMLPEEVDREIAEKINSLYQFLRPDPAP